MSSAPWCVSPCADTEDRGDEEPLPMHEGLIPILNAPLCDCSDGSYEEAVNIGDDVYCCKFQTPLL